MDRRRSTHCRECSGTCHVPESNGAKKGISDEESPVTLFVGAGALASAHGQDADQKTAAVKPVGSASQTVLNSWNDIGRKLIAMAEDFPEDKYDFKPVPAQRSFAEQLLHASGVNYYFTNVVLGEKPPASENPPRDQFKSKAAIVEYVKKSLPMFISFDT